MKLTRLIALSALCLSLTGCAEFVQSLQPLAEEADKAINVIKNDIDNASQKIENGENVTWEDFKFITENEALNSSFKDFDIAKDRVAEAVKEAAQPIPYAETRTYSLDRAALNIDGAFVTCIYLADGEKENDTVTTGVTESTADSTGDVTESSETTADNVNDKADFCFFIYNTADEVTYFYNKFLSENIKEMELAQDAANSPYGVNLVRIGADWYVDTIGEKATDIDSEMIIKSLKNYEQCLELPSENTYKSGGMYNLFNVVVAEQNVTNDIFARSNSENDYVVYTYKAEGLMSITDLNNDYTYLIGNNVKTANTISE